MFIYFEYVVVVYLISFVFETGQRPALGVRGRLSRWWPLFWFVVHHFLLFLWFAVFSFVCHAFALGFYPVQPCNPIVEPVYCLVCVGESDCSFNLKLVFHIG